MPSGLGSALGRQTSGLIKREHGVILPNDAGFQGFDQIAVDRRRRSRFLPLARGRRGQHLAGRQPQIGFRLRAVDADAAFAQQLLRRDVRQIGAGFAQDAVEATTFGVRRRCHRPTHPNAARPTRKPATKAKTENVTDTPR